MTKEQLLQKKGWDPGKMVVRRWPLREKEECRRYWTKGAVCVGEILYDPEGAAKRYDGYLPAVSWVRNDAETFDELLKILLGDCAAAKEELTDQLRAVEEAVVLLEQGTKGG